MQRSNDDSEASMDQPPMADPNDENAILERMMAGTPAAQESWPEETQADEEC
jgi:hypothetical protein